MTMHTVLRGRLNQTLTVNTWTGYKANGDPQFSTTAQTFVCRDTAKRQMIADEQGNNIWVSHEVLVGPRSTAPGTAPSITVLRGRTISAQDSPGSHPCQCRTY